MSAALNRKLKQAHEHLQRGDAARARSLCEEVLRHAPRNPDALYLLGLGHLSEGHAREALPMLREAVRGGPRRGAALEHLGLAHLMLGQFVEAESALATAAALPGAPASVLMRLGVAILEQGRPADARPMLERALALDPSDTNTHLNLGRTLALVGDVAGAQEHFQSVLRLAPRHLDAAFNLGVLALQQQDLRDARQWFERVLAESPQHVDTMVSLGVVLQKQSHLEESAAALRRALSLDPANAAACNNLAATLLLQGRVEEAREHYLAALRVAPDYPAAHEGLAAICLALGRVGEAIDHLHATLRAEPDNLNARATLAGALFENGRLDQAEGAAKSLIELEPGAAAAYATLANVHIIRGELDLAIVALESGYARTKSSNLLGMLAYQLRHACDWPKWQAAWDAMSPAVESGEALGSPFWLLCEPTTAHQQLAYTRRWAAARFDGVTPPAAPARRVSARAHDRLRIGYLSSDLQEHAAAYLITEVLELHDRERFEVFAYSHGPDDRGAMRRRVREACEHFVDIVQEPDDIAAERIRADALDVLVDIKGYTAGDRLSIMARRPCDVQVTWLGYPGTTGATFMDYLIADAFIIPPEMESAYSERILRLPHCYQANDRKRTPAPARPRSEYGIPDDAFVFCCFNQTYKITPDIFGVWMRLLGNTPKSVLWLVDSNRQAKLNLVAAAQAHGVAGERLIFATRMPYAAHLARYGAADLALDTFPYTSHTTLSDALWCGCPSLGLCGDTFAARVSGSILTAADLPDLVTYTLADYEELAGRLAAEPGLLAEVCSRVARARDAAPLFDSTALTRSLERIYESLAGASRA